MRIRLSQALMGAINQEEYNKMMDIVMPNNNEKKFIAIAGRLGYTGLLFLYDFDGYFEKQKNPIQSSKIRIYAGIIANPRNIDHVKNKIKDKNIFTVIQSSYGDREIIERSKANLIFSLEEKGGRDFIHHRSSGLDHVLCKLARENGISIGFSINSIFKSENRHLIMGRITQNIKLCSKYEVKTLIASFAQNPFEMRSALDIKSLFVILGMYQDRGFNTSLENQFHC
jgi:RNase P/RNase MRP subunit p30